MKFAEKVGLLQMVRDESHDIIFMLERQNFEPIVETVRRKIATIENIVNVIKDESNEKADLELIITHVNDAERKAYAPLRPEGVKENMEEIIKMTHKIEEGVDKMSKYTSV